MAISRFQMKRQLRAYGGIMGQDGRRNYGIGSFFQKYIKDPIERSIRGIDEEQQEKESQARVDRLEEAYGKGNTQPVSNFFKDLFYGKETPVDEDGKPIVKEGTTKRTGGILSGLLTNRVALPVAAGLLAGAFTKDKEDPLYTGQDVGLNLQDIGRLANITDPLAGQAIGLRFLPDVEARKFTPEQMTASFAANAPVDFTEQRQQAQSGGIMGDQNDFEEFLQDMQDRDKSMLQDRILQDFEKFMKRKRMLENLPEAKDGGIMKARPKMASYGYNDAMSDTYSSYLEMKKKGLIPSTMTFDEFIQEVVPEMSKRQDTSGMMASAILGDESDEISMGMFGKPVKELNPSEFQELMDYLDDLQKSFRAKGGRVGAKRGGMMDAIVDNMGEDYDSALRKKMRELQKQGEDPDNIDEADLEEEVMKEIKRKYMGKAEGGMMNLGGMEMDLRGGGFVPMGRAEKADDVPARLSKNEFVFTADAVRAAGGGDVDKGADKMYATMKKLEDRIA